MQLHVLSDLHLEFAPVSVPRPKADGVVLAGDIATGEDGILWIRRIFPEVPVLYVLGNHEFYGQALPTLTENLKKECAGTNIHLLENDVFEFGDVVFLGATLWTDFELDANHVLAETLAAVDMADFKQIRFSRTYRKFLPSDSRQLHQESLRWLSDALNKYRGKKIVVVTHHAPSARSIDKKFVGNPLNPAFASRLDQFIEQRDIALWIHGHIHHCSNYQIGRTRIVANTRGYPGEDTGGFNPSLVVEV